MFTQIDDFTINVADKVVSFLNDWLGISTKQVEQCILAFYILVCALETSLRLVNHTHWLLNFIGDVLFFFFLLVFHKQSASERKQRRFHLPEVVYRLCWLFLTTTSLALFLIGWLFIHPFDYNQFLSDAWDVCLLAMLYVSITNVEGERGKKAKMALHKLIEMFGTSWIPVPTRG